MIGGFHISHVGCTFAAYHYADIYCKSNSIACLVLFRPISGALYGFSISQPPPRAMPARGALCVDLESFAWLAGEEAVRLVVVDKSLDGRVEG